MHIFICIYHTAVRNFTCTFNSNAPQIFYCILLRQVMSAGAIPVFVVRDWVRPFREQIDWPSFSFMFTPDEVGTIMLPTLRAVTPEQLKEMQVTTIRRI